MGAVPFDQVILRGCGIDVHKDVVVATIGGEGLKTETRSYKTFSSSLTELKEWLLSEGICRNRCRYGSLPHGKTFGFVGRYVSGKQ